MAIGSAGARPADLVGGLRDFIDKALQENGGSTKPVKPGHRVRFVWPPHPVSYDFHVLASDWTGRATLRLDGEEFELLVARTPYGVFGRCEPLWLEVRGDTEEQMLKNMAEAVRPLFTRQRTIAKTIGHKGRFKDHIRNLPPLDLLKLLYCEDRDVASDARIEIETHARSGLFTPAMIEILKDDRHPYRRSAQWCVLDIFEDLPSFVQNEKQEAEAIQAMADLLWSAEDDYARTTFKAGVVLGGHIPHKHGGPALIRCLKAPSKIGRRSAIHGLFHVVEWIPDMRDTVSCELRQVAESDPEPLLRQYAQAMADDIDAERMDHPPEPIFPDEP